MTILSKVTLANVNSEQLFCISFFNVIQSIPMSNILTMCCCFFHNFYSFNKTNLCFFHLSICKSNTPLTSVIMNLKKTSTLSRLYLLYSKLSSRQQERSPRISFLWFVARFDCSVAAIM